MQAFFNQECSSAHITLVSRDSHLRRGIKGLIQNENVNAYPKKDENQSVKQVTR